MSGHDDLRGDAGENGFDDGDDGDLAAGYALGSLTSEELARYERLLDGSADASREQSDLARVAAALDTAPPTAEPPAGLKARLMEQIAVTPQAVPSTAEAKDAVRPAAAVGGAGETQTTAPAGTRRESSAERRASRRWYSRPAVIVAAAAAAVVLFAGGSALGYAVAQQSAVSTQADALAQITSAPDVQRAASVVSGGGTATLVWSPSLGKSAMIVDGVKSAPNGHTYQLWYIRGDEATSAGLMSGDWQVLNGAMQKGDTVGLTVEPKGGSKQPTTKPVVAIAS